MMCKRTVCFEVNLNIDDENLKYPLLEGIEEYIKDYDLDIENVKRISKPTPEKIKSEMDDLTYALIMNYLLK